MTIKIKLTTAISFLSLTATILAAPMASQLLQESGVQGGLVVQVGGEDDGELTTALHANDRYLVQRLEPDAKRIDAIRKTILDAGQYGPVAVSSWDGKRLPFADGVVNLLVDEVGISRDEAKRVLAPRGVLMTRGGKNGWRKAYTQPVPSAIDEWTHYRYDPSNNNVANDTAVGPPRTVKWEAGPESLRHHDHLPSLNAMVTSQGRLFYIFDEGPAASILFPPDSKLIARDAFSGVTLWKKSIPEWHPHLWPLKSMPATLPRRLVSVEDRVYVTLGIAAPVSELNGANGAQLKMFSGSERCEEIIVHGDTLFALCLTGKGPLDDMDKERHEYLDGRVTKFSLAAKLAAGIMSPQWLHAERKLIAYDLETGKQRWHADGKFAPMSLATDGKQVYFHDSQSVVALDAGTGKSAWKSEPAPIWEEYFSWYGASLVIKDDVVVFSGAENMTWYKGGTPKGATDTMTAFSAKDGKKLWTAAHPPSGYRSPEDLMVVDGLVWAPNSTHKSSAALQGLDLHTGEVKRELTTEFQHGFHHRCYPGKATERYMLLSKVGVNFVPFDGSVGINDQWVRGACGFGFLPANGLIYATPDPCNCYPESKLNGFMALAPESNGKRTATSSAFTRGKAYKALQATKIVPHSDTAWPTYRNNASRNGATSKGISSKLTSAWKAELGGKISAPVIANGKVYVASVDRHQVMCLDAGNGDVIWTKTVGGRVDSPPTILRTDKGDDLCAFGCADGSVYCLRSTDGALVWQRRIAPTDERIVSKEQVESVWPVHGSLLYHNDLLYAVAGRATFIDGGIFMNGLDPVSGAIKISQHRGFEDQVIKGMNTQPAKPDVLSAVGDDIFMGSMAFDCSFEPTQPADGHVFASNGFLNGSWFHRAFWIYGKSWSGGCGGFAKTGNANPAGRMLTRDGNQLFGFGRTKYGWGSAFEYKMYATQLTPGPIEELTTQTRRKARKKKSPARRQDLWSVDSPILVRSLVKAGDQLIAAGPEKLYQEQEAILQLEQKRIQAQVAAQARAWARDPQLMIVSATDGSVVNTLELENLPVWDGMAVAENALFMACTDGSLICLK